MATKYVNSITYGGNEYKLVDNSSGYEANQNAFSNVKVGSTTIAADSKTDTLELVAGDNITLTPDATNDKITIAASGGGGSLPNNYSTIYVSSSGALGDASPQTSSDALTLIAGNNIGLGLNDNGNAITINASVPSAGTTASAVGATSSGGSATTYSKSAKDIVVLREELCAVLVLDCTGEVACTLTLVTVPVLLVGVKPKADVIVELVILCTWSDFE